MNGRTAAELERSDQTVLFVHSDLDDRGLTPPEFRVYCHLMRRSSGGVAYPGIDSMATTCGITKKTVIKAVKSLEELGMIAVDKKPGIVTKYTITAPSQWVQRKGRIPKVKPDPERKVLVLPPAESTPATSVNQVTDQCKVGNATGVNEVTVEASVNEVTPTSVNEVTHIESTVEDGVVVRRRVKKDEFYTGVNQVTVTMVNEVTDQCKGGNATSVKEVTKGNPIKNKRKTERIPAGAGAQSAMADSDSDKAEAKSVKAIQDEARDELCESFAVAYQQQFGVRPTAAFSPKSKASATKLLSMGTRNALSADAITQAACDAWAVAARTDIPETKRFWCSKLHNLGFLLARFDEIAGEVRDSKKTPVTNAGGFSVYPSGGEAPKGRPQTEEEFQRMIMEEIRKS